MKKFKILLCLGLLAVSMAACGKENDGNAEGTEQTAEEETAVQTIPEEDLSTEETMAEGENGTEAAGEEGWSEEMTAVRQAIVDSLGENYWPNMAVTPEMLEASMGITSDMYEDYLAEMPMISTNVDTLLIIKAKSDKVEDVEEALNAYRDNLVNDTMQYPMNVGKIQASRIERIGDYVCFVQLGADTTTVSEEGDEAVITYCQEQNELAIEIIRQSLQQ